MCVGVFFDFLSFTLDQQPKQLQFEKKKNPSPSPSPGPVPCTTEPFYWRVGWGAFIGWMSLYYTWKLFAQKVASLF